MFTPKSLLHHMEQKATGFIDQRVRHRESLDALSPEPRSPAVRPEHDEYEIDEDDSDLAREKIAKWEKSKSDKCDKSVLKTKWEKSKSDKSKLDKTIFGGVVGGASTSSMAGGRGGHDELGRGRADGASDDAGAVAQDHYDYQKFSGGSYAGGGSSSYQQFGGGSSVGGTSAAGIGLQMQLPGGAAPQYFAGAGSSSYNPHAGSGPGVAPGALHHNHSQQGAVPYGQAGTPMFVQGGNQHQYFAGHQNFAGHQHSLMLWKDAGQASYGAPAASGRSPPQSSDSSVFDEDTSDFSTQYENSFVEQSFVQESAHESSFHQSAHGDSFVPSHEDSFVPSAHPFFVPSSSGADEGYFQEAGHFQRQQDLTMADEDGRGRMLFSQTGRSSMMSWSSRRP